MHAPTVGAADAPGACARPWAPRAVGGVRRVCPELPRLAPVLILLPPSEGKTSARRGRPLDLGSLSFPELTPLREDAVRAVAAVSAEPGAPEVLRVSPNLVEDVERNTRLLTGPARVAADVYSGVLYKALDLPSLDAAARRRANRSIVVISALFGAVRLTDRIPAYRVHACADLPGIGHLERVWRPHLAPVLEGAAGERGLVVDCRSSTYASMWRPPAHVARRTVHVTVPGASHMAKHTRGLVTRDLVGREAPRTPEALADALSERFSVSLTPPERPGKTWQLAATAKD